ncbi:MerR family transcriptional regulator [Deinococcus humi]|nr:MerR family transcriptional regulator [Deinococcus humi]
MFTASEVEAQTGVAAATLRQWERRYGFPRPIRNTSGYRLYSPQDIRDIGIMQGHQRLGVSARLAAELTLRGVSADSSGPPPARQQLPPPAQPPSPIRSGVQSAELAHALARALIAADYAQAGDVLAEAHARLPVEDVMTHVMSPSLVEIGALWARGEITIAHERGASHYLRSRLSALMEVAGVEENREGGWGPLVVAACAPGEQHELGLMMLTLALRRRGVRVAYLGANVPLGDLTTFAHEREAQALLLAVNGDWALQDWATGEWIDGRWVPDKSATATDATAGGLAAISRQPILQRLGLPVFLGGALMNVRPELAAELGGLYAGPDAPTAATMISSALGHRSGIARLEVSPSQSEPHDSEPQGEDL